ncbi:MAG: CBS domain-containing protein [Leptospiraceae bacterium]|nr:CBS domain-containing protein [Leptospiraceae bacterium]MCK6381048.1 CBS domain-containing protein [Leptospiraceae bacterium]NUM40204.1 CBS domain-containing protein [Leptospiraceae bacterium]
MICPSCTSHNINGDDTCNNCGHDLRGNDIENPETELQESIMLARIDSLFPVTPVFLKPTDTIRSAVNEMVKNGQGCVLVHEENKLIGIVTERDILFKATDDSIDIDKFSISTIMTKNPDTLKGDAPVAYAMNAMSVGGFRHIPILNSDNSYSVLSVRRLLKHLASTISS